MAIEGVVGRKESGVPDPACLYNIKEYYAKENSI